MPRPRPWDFAGLLVLSGPTGAVALGHLGDAGERQGATGAGGGRERQVHRAEAATGTGMAATMGNMIAKGSETCET